MSSVIGQLTLVLFGSLDEVGAQDLIVDAPQSLIQVFTLAAYVVTAWSTATSSPLHWQVSGDLGHCTQLELTNKCPEAQMHQDSDYPTHGFCQVVWLLRHGQESTILQ